MSIASDFYDMAREMLDDPEIGCDATVKARVKVVPPGQEWKPTFSVTDIPLRVFYTDAVKNMVNGSVVAAGEKVCICYPPDGIDVSSLQTCPFADHDGDNWVINAVESLSVGNETVLLTIKVGK